MSLEQILAAARAGDPSAQFAVAETLEAAGRGDAAAPWLRLAANAGSALANAQLGVWQIIGHHVERAPAEGARRLTAAANAGDDTACAVLASLSAAGLAVTQSWDASLDWLVRAAKLGNARALTQLALLLPGADPSRRRLLEVAARFGNDIAQYFLGKQLIESDKEAERTPGHEWLARAAAAGNPCAEALNRRAAERQGTAAGFALPSDRNAPSKAVLNTLSWSKIRERIDLSAFLSAPPPSEAPLASAPIAIFRGVLQREFCEYVMGLASPGLQRAEVHDDHKGLRVHEMRTNSAMRFSIASTDVIVRLIEQQIAALSGLPLENQEDMNVLRYRPGETYEPHFDFFDPQVERFHSQLESRGQRVMTVLIYLTEDYEGGHTEFELLDYRFKGSRGDALRFGNVDVNGEPHRQMLHTGLPPTSGEKWIISKWIHDRAQADRGWRA
jgi:prolyl 4-hydroxylase